MIIKQIPFYRSRSKHKSFFDPVNYVNRGADDENDITLFINISKGFDQNSVVDSFEKNNLLKGSRMKVDGQHIVLSFNKLDKENITREMLINLANKFLEVRNYNNCVVWGRVHYAENVHFHLICSQNYFNSSKSCNIDSMKKFMSQNREIEEFQKLHYEKELANSFVYINHKQKELKPLKKTPRAQIKNKVIDLLNQLEPSAKSLSHLCRLIQEKQQEIRPYGRGKQPYYGVKSGKLSFRFENLLAPERLEVLKRLEQLQEIQKRSDDLSSPSLTR